MPKSNVVTLPKSESRINVERKIKSHNDPKKKNGIPVYKAEFNMIVDFSKCTAAEIMAIAVDQIVITYQAKARTAFFAKSNMGKDGKTPVKSFNMIVKENIPAVVDVQAAVVSKTRAAGTSVERKVAEKWKGLTPKQIQEKLEELATLAKLV